MENGLEQEVGKHSLKAGMLGKQDFTKLGENSYGNQWNENSVKKMASVLAHENAHAYDFHVIGKGNATDMPSMFTEHGKNSGTMGPCWYATNYPGETISTVCEMVINKKVTSDANLSNGRRIDKAYHDKYGEYPSQPYSSTVEKRMYDIWASDPEWAPLVAEAERIMF